MKSVGEVEQNEPFKFLEAGGQYRNAIVGDFMIIGTITNRATVTSYKDVILDVSFLTSTSTLLETKSYAIYDVFSPNTVKDFRLRLGDAPSNASKLNWKVRTAAPN